MVFDASQSEDGNGRDDDKRQQNRPKPLQSDVASQSPHDSCRSGDGQQPWECGRLAIAGQEERQHRHDEDAEAETRSALDETRTDAQQEYRENETQLLLKLGTNLRIIIHISP